MEKVTLVSVIIILTSVTVFLGTQIAKMDLASIAMGIIVLLIVTFAYKRCSKKVRQRPRPMKGNYWYDMKCTYLAIFMTLILVFVGVTTLEKLS